MKEYTLVYIKRENQILLLNRNKKENDINKGKWIGVGGKLEADESHLDCMLREVKEETHLTASTYKYLGEINFYFDELEEKIHLYVVTQFSGMLNPQCNEGDLAFVEVDKIKSLPMWESDHYFLPFVFQEKTFRKIAIRYQYDVLEEVKVNNRIQYSIHHKMMELAIQEAKKAFQKQEVPIGCVITKKNKVLIKTHNTKEKDKHALHHAELNAIHKLLKKIELKYLDDCIIYTTLEPCLLCSGAIIQARIPELYYAAKDKKAGFSVSNLKLNQAKGIHHKIQIKQLKQYEEEVSFLLKDFFKKRRQ